ncbi:MAG: hypothetical protein IJS99_10660 [Synergistaceae bacterium]|nr:hypothetical protein [Synergistaceae bacterium]
MKQRNYFWEISAAFLVCAAIHVILHFTIFNFPRAIRISPDELRYYDIARTLFHGQGLELRGLPTTFQKIGYSLVIAPFFAISDAVLRLKIIGVANIFIMSLSVIFAGLIARELKLGRKSSIFLVIITAIWPDMMYAMTYMSETLYWPLYLLFIYLWMVNERKKSYTLAIFEGILCYFAYLTKEIALAFILACIAYEIIYPVINKFVMKVKIFYERKRIYLLLAFIAAFGICFIAMKLTLFRGLGNSYNQMGISAVLSAYNFAYMIYAVFYYIAAVLVGALIIPVIWPLINFREMNETARKLFVYMILLALITIMTIAYTVSIRCDLGEITPSIHYRYCGALFIIFLALFLSSLQAVRLDKKFACLINFIAVIYACFMFRGLVSMTSADQYLLLWYMAIEKFTGILLPPAGKYQVIYPAAIIAGLLLIILAAIFYYIYTRKSATQAKKFFACVMLIMCVGLNLAAGKVIDYAYHVDSESVNQIVRINNFLASQPDSKTLYITQGDSSKRYDRFGRYADTYIENRRNFYFVQDTSLPDSDNINLAGINLKSELANGDYYINGVNYIMLESVTDFGTKKLSNIELVPDMQGEHFVLYKNLSPDILMFTSK